MMHFKPKAGRNCTDESELHLNIQGFPIKKVNNTKFFGVIIDENLSWEPHVAALRRKLNYASATLYRIRDSVPKELHCDLYHTLFESHLTYCISVWGGANDNITSKVWTAQKHCMRVLFGDKKAYLDKFKTCAKPAHMLARLSVMNSSSLSTLNHYSRNTRSWPCKTFTHTILSWKRSKFLSLGAPYHYMISSRNRIGRKQLS